MSVPDDLKNRKETLWINYDREEIEPGFRLCGYGPANMKAAQNRFMRFMPFIESAFPETAAKKGIIESELINIPEMFPGMKNVFLKDDARLPVAGSVKARGGIHEVLKFAEMTAQKAGLLSPGDNYAKLDSKEFREFFSQYKMQVGSTGNLGISIGRMSARLGFTTIVHMSNDAKEWKKELLRSEGVNVIEYAGDYGLAVANGRAQSDADPMSHFVDDERSEDLFFGYASVGYRLKVQLYKAGIPVDRDHPLYVYIPCGVGGAPGGITFGLCQMFGSNVHCYFAEPVESPCFTLSMATGKGNEICVQDIGLSGKTEADGLAVGRSSGLSCKLMKPLMAGAFTVSDDRLPIYQDRLLKAHDIFLEPSACAGFLGPEIIDAPENATHIVWGTGGGLVPEEAR